MSPSLRAPKELWLGLLYVLTGTAGYVLSREYPFGTGARMGPGYFPTIVSSLLVLFGIGAIARAFFLTGTGFGKASPKIIALVIGSQVLFGLLLERAGFVVAGLALLFVSAAASANARFEWKAVLGAVAIVLACAFVFIQMLGVPMLWVGPWLQPLLPSTLLR